jgi:hypothetical protein
VNHEVNQKSKTFVAEALLPRQEIKIFIMSILKLNRPRQGFSDFFKKVKIF